jgi:hypothetical protein
MSGSDFRYSGRSHVAVADRLDLLKPMPRADPVEPTEQLIEHANYLRGF